MMEQHRPESLGCDKVQLRTLSILTQMDGSANPIIAEEFGTLLSVTELVYDLLKIFKLFIYYYCSE